MVQASFDYVGDGDTDARRGKKVFAHIGAAWHLLPVIPPFATTAQPPKADVGLKVPPATEDEDVAVGQPRRKDIPVAVGAAPRQIVLPHRRIDTQEMTCHRAAEPATQLGTEQIGVRLALPEPERVDRRPKVKRHPPTEDQLHADVGRGCRPMCHVGLDRHPLRKRHEGTDEQHRHKELFCTMMHSCGKNVISAPRK